MTLGSVAGMRVTVHWAYALLLLGAAMAGYTVHALILAGSLIAHEIAHLAVAWVLEIGVDAVELTPFGGVARLDSALEADPQAETSVALAGPFQSFFLAGLAQVLPQGGMWDRELVQFFYQTNVSLAFFNLLPALPLDGGRALRGLLAQRWGYRKVTGWMVWCARVCGAVLVLLSVAAIPSGHLYPTPLLGGAFLFLSAEREVEAAMYRSFRRFLRKKEEVLRRNVMPVRQVVAVEGTRLRDVMTSLGARGYHTILVVDHRLQPLGTVSEAEIITAFQELGPEVCIETLV